MKKLAVLASAALLLATTGVQANDAAKHAAAAAINDAVQAALAAGKARGEWRDTFKTIGKAKKAFKKGDYDQASKLAGKAKFQGEMGQQQAHAGMHADIPSYVK
jgi:hypothetical protein